MRRGIVRGINGQTLDVQLLGSAHVAQQLPVLSSVNLDAVRPGQGVLVDQVDGKQVVVGILHQEAVVSAERPRLPGEPTRAAPPTDYLKADGSVPLRGNLAVLPGVTVDGYDISVLGEAIGNLQAAQAGPRTGYTIFSHSTQLLLPLDVNGTTILVADGIFSQGEVLAVSNLEGQVEIMQVVSQPLWTTVNGVSGCQYTVTRRVATNPGNVVVGWAQGTVVYGLTRRGWIAVDARDGAAANPALTFSLFRTDPPDFSQTERIVRIGNLANVLGYSSGQYGFAFGRLTSGSPYVSYSDHDGQLRLQDVSLSVRSTTGEEVARIEGRSEQAGQVRFGTALSCFEYDPQDNTARLLAGGKPVVSLFPDGARFTGMVWAGAGDGPQVGIGALSAESATIVARDRFNVPRFLVETDSVSGSVHVHIGRPKPSPGYLEFQEGELTVDGRISAREFYLIGEGSITPGSSLVNEGRIQVGTGELAAVLDGQDPTWRIYAGADVPGSAPFRVNKWGDAYLRNAVIDSAVFADYAEIGGWRIGATTASGDSADDILSDDGGNVLSASGHYLVSAGGGVILNGSDNSISIMSEEFGQPGVQLQWNNGSPRAYIGNGADRYFRWTGNNLAWKGANTELTEAGLFVAQNAQIAGQITATSGAFTGAVYVGASAPRVVIDGAAKEIRSENFASGAAGWRIGPTGDAEFNNLVARGSIVTAVFQKSLVTAFAGSQIVAKSASTLHEACTVNGSAFPLKVKKQDGAAPFAAGDIVHLKDGALSTWATVDAGSDGGDHWAYTATYQSGNSIGQYRAGHAVVDYGQSGDGFVVITADQSGAPYLSVRTHAGQPWNTVTERARLGNLSGIGGASGYGLWTDNGYFTGTVYANAGQIGQWSIAGGNLTAANARIKASVPSIELGDATGYDAGGAGVWLGNDGGVYKARIGRKPSDGYGYLAWTGTSLIFRADNMGGNVNQSIDVGTAGHIKGGATGYNVGSGFWMGYDAGYKFYVGNSSGHYLRWTGSALEITGSITIASGSGGGWTFTADALVSANARIKSSTPSIELGDATGYDAGGTGVWFGNDSGTYKARIGRKPSDGYGYLAWTGTSLIINVSNLGGTVNSALDVGTTGHIKGGATGFNVGSGFWLGYDAGAHKFYVGNSSGHYLRWTGSALEIKGTVDVTQGNILGSVDVGTSGSIRGGATGFNTGTGFWMGHESGVAKFRVGSDTQYMRWTGTQLEIAGTINATSGNIAGFTLTSGSMYSGSGTSAFVLSTSESLIRFGDYATIGLSAGTTDTIKIGPKLNAPTLIVGTSFQHLSTATFGVFGVTPIARRPAFTFTNFQTSRSVNRATMTLGQLGDIVYTIWQDLVAYGLLQ